jgi:hypothetical protein
VPLDGEWSKLRFVPTAVVAAEQQLVAAGKDGSDVCLSAAAVAAVDGLQWADDGSGHGAPLGR